MKPGKGKKNSYVGEDPSGRSSYTPKITVKVANDPARGADNTLEDDSATMNTRKAKSQSKSEGKTIRIPKFSKGGFVKKYQDGTSEVTEEKKKIGGNIHNPKYETTKTTKTTRETGNQIPTGEYKAEAVQYSPDDSRVNVNKKDLAKKLQSMTDEEHLENMSKSGKMSKFSMHQYNVNQEKKRLNEELKNKTFKSEKEAEDYVRSRGDINGKKELGGKSKAIMKPETKTETKTEKSQSEEYYQNTAVKNKKLETSEIAKYASKNKVSMGQAQKELKEKYQKEGYSEKNGVMIKDAKMVEAKTAKEKELIKKHYSGK